MNNINRISSIEKNVMAKIKNGQAKMHPKIYYSILSSLGVLMVLLFGFVNAFVMSLVTMWLRVQVAQGPAYGAKRNLANMIDSFPWWALLVGIISLVVAIYFIRKVGNLYKVRLSYLILSVVIVSLLLGLALSYSSAPSVFNRHEPASFVLIHK